MELKIEKEPHIKAAIGEKVPNGSDALLYETNIPQTKPEVKDEDLTRNGISPAEQGLEQAQTKRNVISDRELLEQAADSMDRKQLPDSQRKAPDNFKVVICLKRQQGER